MKRIVDHRDISAALEALLAADPALCVIAACSGPVPLRLRAPGFHGLSEIVVSQQVSKASAAAIFTRLTGLIDPYTPQVFLAAGEVPLIEAGLSRAKQRTLTEIARTMEDGALDPDHLCTMVPSAAQAQLTAIRGVGPWTAEVFLLFCAGHPDIFPAGDVALQHAVGHALELPQRPSEKEVRGIAERWSPHRGTAARLMWAYYAHLKSGRDALPV